MQPTRCCDRLACPLALMALLAVPGCSGAPQVAQQPRATIEPKLSAGDNAQIRQDLRQLQQSISTLTNNFGLDTERRKLKEVEARKRERLILAGLISITGILIVAFVCKLDVGPHYRPIFLLVGLCCIPGGLVLALLWPI